MTRGVGMVLRLVTVGSVVIAVPAALAQQDYPARAIRVIYPFPPGSGFDRMIRVLSQRLAATWGQPVVVENRTGAGGTIGAELVAKSAPDGYTLLVSTASLAVNATLSPRLPVANLAPVSQLASSGIIISAHPSVPAGNLGELLALARARREGLNFGSNGTGTTSHLVGAWLQHLGGFRLTHIPYKGQTPALAAVVGGEVDVATPASGPTAAALIKARKMRGIAVTMLWKSSVLPELPLVASVFPGFDVDNWMGMWVPAGTAPAVVNKLHAELANGLQHPDFKQVLQGTDERAVGSTPAEFTTHFRREVDKYAKIIKLAGIKPEG